MELMDIVIVVGVALLVILMNLFGMFLFNRSYSKMSSVASRNQEILMESLEIGKLIVSNGKAELRIGRNLTIR